MILFSFLYNVAIRLYYFVALIASLYSDKAKLWVEGRNNQKIITISQKSVWFHCASLGEFEQAKPLIEKLKNSLPNHVFVLTFFSPSGYEVKKNYKLVDYVYYLPIDTKKNANDFINKINPELVFFVKYELWDNYLSVLKAKNISTFLFSANFRENQIFFKSYGVFFKEMLFKFNHIFVQNEKSLNLLNSIDINHCSIANDTRFDTVISTRNNKAQISEIEKFINNEPCIVIGSSWLKDELIWIRSLYSFSKYKIIIAPHVVTPKRITQLQEIFKDAVLHSKLKEIDFDKRILIIDSVGKLTQIYQYATITYIGGGFDSSIHNILEPAVFGVPILFGKNFIKSQEAIDLIEMGGAFSVKNSESLKEKTHYLETGNNTKISGEIAEKYVYANANGSEQLIEKLKELKVL